jgi:hypothetical protein
MTAVTNPSASYQGLEARPRPSIRLAYAVLVISVGSLISGCGGKGDQAGAQPAPARQVERGGGKQIPISNTDPCAMRLHDLCAPLLLYYNNNHNLPARLEDLREVVGFQDQVILTCPTSNRPYIYNPVGVVNSNQPERIIIYDAEPHGGIRWAISIVEPQGDGALVTKVVGLQESQFHFSLPR